MRRLSLSRRPCTIARSADQLGDAWSLLVLRDVFLGVRRFADLQERLGIATNSLASRLSALKRHGLLEARPYSRKPPRWEYELTEKGRDALPVLLAMAAWGARWLSPAGAPLVLVDPKSRREVEPVVVDRRSGKPLRAGSVAVLPGPGAPKSLKKQLVTPLVFAAPEAP
jgi:DNA-binding HxlR family transcriptional regulator